MKKHLFIIVCTAMLLSSCGTYTGTGTYIGAQFGGILGSAIGGISNGGRGSDVGTIIGMAGGAIVGGAIGNAKDKADARDVHEHYQMVQERKAEANATGNYGSDMYDDTDSGFDASGSGDDILYDFSGPDYTDGYSATQPSSSNVAPAATSALVEVRNARFVDDNRDNIITSNELSKVIFEVVNTSHVTLYNIQPIVEETTGNKHIIISPSVHVESLTPGSAIRYTAMVKADKLKAGTVCFKVSVKTGSQTISKIQEFNIPTAKK